VEKRRREEKNEEKHKTKPSSVEQKHNSKTKILAAFGASISRSRSKTKYIE
jgi:hypothetical protein